jgi:hypothetical protein
LLVPRNRWIAGSWNNKLKHFLPLARWFGVNSTNPTMDELQELRKLVEAKVFTESVPEILNRLGPTWNREKLSRKLVYMWDKLGLGDPIGLRSLQEAEYNCDPTKFEGVALLMPGTMSWTGRRWERTELVRQAGAKFKRVIVFYSSRLCKSSPDWRHPYIRFTSAEGREPTEEELLRQWLYGRAGYEFAELPATPIGQPLPAKAQLEHFKSSGQFDQLVGDSKVFVATNPNALYVPLHVRDVLGLDDIWFSQGASRLVNPLPKHWWPEDQDALTTTSGTIRLWIELRRAGLINDKAS